MVGRPEKTLEELVADMGRFREDAFLFVRDGLNFAVEQVHGPATDQLLKLFQYLRDNDIDLAELVQTYGSDQIDPRLAQAVESAGGIEKFNRHVSGQELCWGLRDFAVEKWGMLARTVLRRWGVRRTRDFGDIVFAMINGGFMQKQPNDSIDDFKDVFDFGDAFDAYVLPDSDGTSSEN